MTYRVAREHRVYSFSRRHQPVLTVAPGSEVVLETNDCFDGQMPHEADPAALGHIQPGRGNPATGLVAVEGAEPGMTLVAEILDITCADRGIVYATDRRTNVLQVRIPGITGDTVAVADGLTFALDPVIGVIGVAPSYGEVPNSTPGRHGGNLDCCDVKCGAKVYLPVGVSGALFGCGDIHALQADGEVCGMGVEVAGEVRVRLSLLPEVYCPWPVVETLSHFAVLTAAHTLDEAAHQAVDAARTLLVERGGYSDPDALILQSLLCDLRINQIVDPLVGVRACLPRTVLPALR